MATEYFRTLAAVEQKQQQEQVEDRIIHCLQEKMAKKSPDFSWLPEKQSGSRVAFFNSDFTWAVSIDYNMMAETALWFNHPIKGWRQTKCCSLGYGIGTSKYHDDTDKVITHMLVLEKMLQDAPTRDKAEAEAMAYLA